jgi:hypothetical protein
MLGYIAVGGLQRETACLPREDPARHVVGVEAGAPKRLGRHGRAATAAAVEDYECVAVNLVGVRGQLCELQVTCTRDPARIVLVGLADVDQLDLASREDLGDLLGAVVIVHTLERNAVRSVRPLGRPLPARSGGPVGRGRVPGALRRVVITPDDIDLACSIGCRANI